MKRFLQDLKSWRDKQLIKKREKIVKKNRLLDREKVLLDKEIELVEKEIAVFEEILEALDKKKVPRKYRKKIIDLSKKGQLVAMKKEILELIEGFEDKK